MKDGVDMNYLENNKKKKYIKYIDDNFDKLWELSKYVYENPEVAFTEVKAAEVQKEFLKNFGFSIQDGDSDLPTSFIASYERGTGGPNIGIISEYDALPGIGHACGHNLICATAMGTAILTKHIMEQENLNGRLFVYGTPAEESGGGKIIMLEKGLFEGLDGIIFMHPTSDTTKMAGACMSSNKITINYKGKAAHAGSHPQRGINALSAGNLFFTAVGLLRQHFSYDTRVSGIFSKGGDSVGQIPGECEIIGSISCFKEKDLISNTEKIVNCAKGCGQALGCEVDVKIKPGYLGRVPNLILSETCREEFEFLGEPVMPGLVDDFGGEDLGNVSRLIPICNPYMTIFPDYKISGHTQQFKELAISDAGKKCIDVSSKAMSLTIIKWLLNPGILDQAKEELQHRIEEGV